MGTPKVCHGALPSSWVPGDAGPVSGIPGLQQVPVPTVPSGMFGQKSPVWFMGQAGGVCLVAGPFRLGGAGRCPSQPQVLPEKMWARCSSGGPPALQTTNSCPRLHWPTPTLPQGLPPPPSILPSARPLARRVSPPPVHIWFSLGSPRMPLTEGPLPRGRWAGGLG